MEKVCMVTYRTKVIQTMTLCQFSASEVGCTHLPHTTSHNDACEIIHSVTTPLLQNIMQLVLLLTLDNHVSKITNDKKT